MFETLTLDDIRNASKDELLQGMHYALTALPLKQIADLFWTIKQTPIAPNTFQTLTQGSDDHPGQLLRIYRNEDILGTILGFTKTEWTYYPTGEVDTITTTELDPDNQVVSVQTIKHFTDGQQPILVT